MADPCAALEPLLSAHLDGELDAPLGRAVAEHLRACADCAAECDELRVVRSLVRSLPVRRLPEGSALRAPTADEGAAPRGTPVLARAAVVLGVAAGLLTGAALSLGGRPPTQIVDLPRDVYVADHFVHTVGRAVSAPVLVDLQR